MKPPALSLAATTVLQTAANGYRYGFDIIGATGLPAGTVYPILRRLEAAGYLRSRWEEHAVAQREQRPPRKYYEMTTSGRHALAAAVDRFRMLQQTSPKRVRTPKPSRT